MRLVSFVFVLFLSLLRLHAEPINVMVEDLTFNRPDAWKWAEPTPGAVARFLIPDSDKGTATEVRFHVLKRDYAAERSALKAQFPEAFHQQEIKVGTQKIVYFDIGGTYTFQNHSPKTNQLWISAAIPSGKQFVYVRMQGGRANVEGSLAMFKKMVEGAVKEREAESVGK